MALLPTAAAMAPPLAAGWAAFPIGRCAWAGAAAAGARAAVRGAVGGPADLLASTCTRCWIAVCCAAWAAVLVWRRVSVGTLTVFIPWAAATFVAGCSTV